MQVYMTEAGLKRRIDGLARANGGLIFRLTGKGDPDVLYIFRNGVVLFIEFKSPGGLGRLSLVQRERIDDIRRHGQRVLVISSYDEGREAVEAAAGAGCEVSD